MEINPTIYSSIESPTQKTPEEEKNRADSISSITTDFNKLNSFGDNSTQELLSVRGKSRKIVSSQYSGILGLLKEFRTTSEQPD
mmetsp:Transcript_21504/g.19071  ORF Transcript_21504/g.19071 Transcript_21504/m.19071 type:complete len:84 (+) Transcript_21504:451-702(+)